MTDSQRTRLLNPRKEKELKSRKRKRVVNEG